MFGQISHEVEVNVPASSAWSLYSTLRLAKFVEEQIPGLLGKIELLEGDGGVGTVLKLTYPPGTPGNIIGCKERFTKVDNEKLVKEVEVLEGGFLDIGFTFYRVRFQVIEKGSDSCIIKSTIEYDVKEEAAENASFVSIEPLARIADVAKGYLVQLESIKLAAS